MNNKGIHFTLKKLKDGVSIKYDIKDIENYEFLNKLNTGKVIDIISKNDNIEHLKHYHGTLYKNELVVMNKDNKIILKITENFLKINKEKKVYGEKFIKSIERIIENKINQENDVSFASL